MIDPLDDIANRAVDKILSRYCDPSFFEGLGEPFSTTLRQICTDCVKVGISMGTMIVDDHPFRPTIPDDATGEK